ncbi:hypothetical protein M0812_19025 [Anaeramoeba flamelloides]|uniref:Complex 1 LYR protein domain-containing protein n=1 Tax=Anaeramoeba flamelloides TaxID=1746091 RepID=A0AAV7Z4I0_9EUKA|nr:hypothetical protein M0812_19025 [Anaeramoeba flamelloides]
MSLTLPTQKTFSFLQNTTTLFKNHFSTITTKQLEELKKITAEEASKFTNYNFREYFKERTNDMFDEFLNNDEKSEEQVTQFYDDRLSEYEMIKRQALIGKLYPEQKFVTEN